MRANLKWTRTALTVLMMWPLTTLADEPGSGQTDIGAQTPADAGTPPPAYAAAQIVVKPKAGATPAEFLEDGAVLGLLGSLAHSPAFLLDLVPGSNVDSAVAALTASGHVTYAHPNYVFNTLHPVQGSYPFPDVNAVGEYTGQPASLALSLVSAHTRATGSGTRVGVIDGGVDLSHPLLAGVVVAGHDFVDDDDLPQDEPGGTCSGHGTFVAGMIHLVAPDAQKAAYRVADREGRGDGFTLARAIEAAVDDGCDIINISLVLMKRHLAVRDAILYAESQGVLVVAAAGNSAASTPMYPAAETGAMAVGALDDTDKRASFSSYGSHLSVCAPGVELYSMYDQGYAWWSGTSFAAPLVAGAAALVAELLPAASGNMLRGVLELTAVDLDAANPTLPGLLGAGRIDPVAALDYTTGPEWATATPDTLFFTHQVGRLYLLAPFEYVHLTSTNAPASYFAEVIGPDSAFAWVSDSVGSTPDSVRVEISPPNVPGTFINTVVFHVEGVAEPARVVVHLEVEDQDSAAIQAWVAPDMLYFQAQAGVEVLLSQPVLVASQPEGLPYTVAVLPGTGLTSLDHSSGTTHDTVTILVDPARAFSPGMYEDTVVFQVEGVPYPIPLFVMIYIMDSLPTPSATTFVVDTVAADPGTNVDLSLRVGQVGGEWGGFDLLLEYPATLSLVSTGPGSFPSGCEWEHFAVSAPAPGRVRVVAVAQLFATPGDPSCLAPSPGDELARLTFSVPSDSGGGCAIAPVRFVWESCANNSIASTDGVQITLVSTEPGSVRDYDGSDLTGSPVYGGPPEPCPDGITILRTSRFQNGAVKIGCDSQPPADTAWAMPSSLYFTTVEGFVPTVMLSQWVYLYASGAPRPYVAGVDASDPIFTYFIDSTGWTNDSVEVLVNPVGHTAGSYQNTVRFYVNGVSQPAVVNVFLTVQSDDVGGSDTAAVVPSLLTVQAQAGSSTVIERSVLLYSTNAGALYFAAPSSWPGFLSVPDSVGHTPDTVRVWVDPSGLAAGLHEDTILFDVAGTSFPVRLAVRLLLTSGDTIPPVAPKNFPNPFNPETQIAFTLPAAGRVQLVVYNLLGERVASLVDSDLPAGEQRFTWKGTSQDGREVPSGVYFYRLTVKDQVYTGKMMMLR